jgi:hypothetical protein
VTVYLGQFFNYKDNPHFCDPFSTVKIMQKLVGLQFRRFFQNLIWSP